MYYVGDGYGYNMAKWEYSIYKVIKNRNKTVAQDSPSKDTFWITSLNVAPLIHSIVSVKAALHVWFAQNPESLIRCFFTFSRFTWDTQTVFLLIYR